MKLRMSSPSDAKAAGSTMCTGGGTCGDLHNAQALSGSWKQRGRQWKTVRKIPQCLSVRTSVFALTHPGVS